MPRHLGLIAVSILAAVLMRSAPAAAQPATSPESMTAARELVVTMRSASFISSTAAALSPPPTTVKPRQSATAPATATSSPSVAASEYAGAHRGRDQGVFVGRF